MRSPGGEKRPTTIHDTTRRFPSLDPSLVQAGKFPRDGGALPRSDGSTGRAWSCRSVVGVVLTSTRSVGRDKRQRGIGESGLDV
ncbi:hypothetical protein R1flu_001664 [Riccia fluitans]|uniref:Uncharacterized protein n=1 Tax=Riccia fluitans TaxID=41844 RepID=A0ABD1Y4Y3_9MARC